MGGGGGGGLPGALSGGGGGGGILGLRTGCGGGGGMLLGALSGGGGGGGGGECVDFGGCAVSALLEGEVREGDVVDCGCCRVVIGIPSTASLSSV